jgi:hypothetical protein
MVMHIEARLRRLEAALAPAPPPGLSPESLTLLSDRLRTLAAGHDARAECAALVLERLPTLSADLDGAFHAWRDDELALLQEVVQEATAV